MQDDELVTGLLDASVPCGLPMGFSTGDYDHAGLQQSMGDTGSGGSGGLVPNLGHHHPSEGQLCAAPFAGVPTSNAEPEGLALWNSVLQPLAPSTVLEAMRSTGHGSRCSSPANGSQRRGSASGADCERRCARVCQLRTT